MIGQALNVRIDVCPELKVGRNGRRWRPQTPALGQWRRWAVTAEKTEHPAARLRQLPKALVGPLKSCLANTDPVAPATWRALLDYVFDWDEARTQPHYALRYVAIADRARAEVRVQQRQPELIDRLVQRSIRDTGFQATTASTLYELLLPNDLKDSLGQLTRLVLEVDAETAGYPWELMMEGGEPLCVKLGFVRQLETVHFRSHIRASTAMSAYVVGNPLTDANLPGLPHAGDEARRVAALLRRDFEVELKCERPTAQEVFGGLFARPYRILHLAGHGYYEASANPGQSARSGMLLENGLFLTAVEIGQMRNVPDLAFVNCCYLGQVGAEAGAASGVPFNKLAASLSRELIEMGVRAVVAAGWAVRDDAAAEFAEVFYGAMLGGETFGNALKEARLKIWERYRDCNTWGAYQAYGDPDFRLTDTQDSKRDGKEQRYVAVEEVLYALRSIWIETQDLGTDPAVPPEVTDKRKASLKERLSDLQKECSPRWMTNGELLHRFGRVYGELGEFAVAIDYYQRALITEDSENPVNMTLVEQLANLEARLGQKTNAPELIDGAVKRLGNLVTLGDTCERLALLGSACKRQAQIGADEDLTKLLKDSAEWYRQAAETGIERGHFDPYHALNWITIQALLGAEVPDSGSWLARCEAAAVERYAANRIFWDAVALADADVARRLLSQTLQSDAVEDIVAHYRNVFAAAQATPREQDSVLNQLKFIQSTLERLGDTGAAGDAIRAILYGLTGEGEPKPASAQRRPSKKRNAKVSARTGGKSKAGGKSGTPKKTGR